MKMKNFSFFDKNFQKKFFTSCLNLKQSEKRNKSFFVHVCKMLSSFECWSCQTFFSYVFVFPPEMKSFIFRCKLSVFKTRDLEITTHLDSLSRTPPHSASNPHWFCFSSKTTKLPLNSPLFCFPSWCSTHWIFHWFFCPFSLFNIDFSIDLYSPIEQCNIVFFFETFLPFTQLFFHLLNKQGRKRKLVTFFSDELQIG